MGVLQKKSLTQKRLSTQKLTSKQKTLNPQAKIDVLDTSVSARKRRQPTIELQSEDRLLKTYDRLRAINLVRDLERNFSVAKSLITQIRTNVVGSGPKIRVHSEDHDFSEWAESTFNRKFAPNCDFRGSTHFGDMLSLALGSAVREGDILWVYDDGWIDDTGKILLFEADQLVDVEDLQNAPSPWNQLNQQSGVLYDNWGRVKGFSVTAEHGKTSEKASKVTFIDAANARLLKEEWRPNALRGQSAMLTAAADLQDIYEIRAKELQTMKTLASFAGTIHKEGVNKQFADLAQAQIDNGEEVPQVQYDRLENLTGGLIEYMEPGEEFKPVDFNRPSIDFQEACQFVLRSAGSALGLSKTYTTLSTEASYTAFRGDMLISWGKFYQWQKQLERQVCDWIAHKAIQWYADKEGVTVPEYTVSWGFPELPTIDPLKDAMADRERIGNLTTTYQEMLGPDWRDKFDQIATEIAYAKTKGIPLDMIYGEAGAIAATRTLGPKPNDPQQQVIDSSMPDATDADTEDDTEGDAANLEQK